MLEIGMNQTKGILAKAGSVPWLAWHHSQTSICTGRGKTGVRRWGCCIKPGLMPDTLCWPTKGRSHFFFRYSQMCEYAFLVLHVWFEFPMEQAVGEDAASGGLCKQDLLEKWEALRLAVLIYQPQWFTVIDIHIPECQNRLCLKRNQWLRLWFYLRPFPDKRLNRAWSCENTMREHHCPASVCAQGLGKGHRHWGWPPRSCCTGLCTEHLRSPLQR